MKKYTVLPLLVLLSCCTSNTIYKKPKDLIPKDTMALLLTDLFIASSSYYKKRKEMGKEVNYMSLVYDKYGIDSSRFRKSNRYYTSRIDEYDALYKKIKSDLEARIEILEEEKRVQDSITRKLPSAVEKEKRDFKSP